MNKKTLISVVISAYNEEAKIADCLDSVTWADEVIMIDNESTDKTAEIAKKRGATVLSRKNNLMLNVNKNWGFAKAKHDWILSLDADERVTPELHKEIETELAALEDGQTSEIEGFWIPRRNIIFGKWIEHTGWYPDYVLRLFRKEKGRFEEKHIHEMVTIAGESKQLRSDLIHLNYETVAQFLRKTIVIYAPSEAAAIQRKGYTVTFSDAFRFPLDEFLSRYFSRQGYKDGFHGLMLSLLMALYHFVVFTNLWEMKGFPSVGPQNTLEMTGKEMAKRQKDIRYWMYTGKIDSSKNSTEKIIYKILRKV